MQSASGHLLCRGLESDGRNAKGRAEQGGERPSEGMADDPDVGVGVHVCYVIV